MRCDLVGNKMYSIKCSCGDSECSAEMEITEHFDEEGNIEILIYNGGLPNSIYMDYFTITELRKCLAMILMKLDKEDEDDLGFC